jgi:hypothetical protein
MWGSDNSCSTGERKPTQDRALCVSNGRWAWLFGFFIAMLLIETVDGLILPKEGGVMIRTLLLSAICVLTLGAQAAWDVHCYDGDCLSSGWRVENLSTRAVSEVMCIRGDCESNGWREIYQGRVVAEVICTDQNCFRSGWQTFDPQRAYPTYTVICSASRGREPNCFQHGWETYDARQAWLSSTLCWDGDCEAKGWDVRLSNGGWRSVTCKEPGCFASGWTLRP